MFKNSWIALNYMREGGMPHVVGQFLTKGYNFVLDLTSIGGLHKKL
jgi:hypothetical protein